MKNLLKYSLITALLVSAASCNLDEEIKGDFTQDFDPANPGVGVKNNVNKPTPNDGLSDAFSKLFAGSATNGGFWNVQELASDEVVVPQRGGDWYDGGVNLEMHKHNFTPQTVSINDAWENAYNGIFQCNDLLDNGLNASANAQLRFLRAYFYYRLMDLFGNVPIVTVAGQGANQSTRAQVFDFIEAELLAAIPNLPAAKPEYARANQSAAYALLSRLYLNAQVYRGTPMYQKAIDAADMVINSSLYNLSPEYKDVFDPDNVENTEHIFVIPYDEATGTGMNYAQMTLHYPSQLTYRLQSQPWNGYAAMEEFYNSYEAADKRKANNFIAGPQVDIEGNPILDLAFDKADDDGPAINYTPHLNELAPNASRQAGARLGKFSFKIGQGDNMDNDFPVLRYGEVLLNKAEAIARLGGGNFSNPTTLALVNQLRTRAGVATFASLTEGQMLAERGRELFIEALRRPDLIRFGAYGNAWWEKPAHSAPHKNIFPIPLQQMQASASTTFKLVQNPGY
jgi:starch-binding outer membrane protein, SusD/RagB family